MSTPLTLLAQITARPGHAAAVADALRELVAASRQESGSLQYDLHVQRDDADRFVMIEQWQDDAALQAHCNTPHYLHFGQTFGDRVVGLELEFPVATA